MAFLFSSALFRKYKLRTPRLQPPSVVRKELDLSRKQKNASDVRYKARADAETSVKKINMRHCKNGGTFGGQGS